MKRWLITLFFNRYRVDIESLFIADLISHEIPKEISERTLKFLLVGKRQMDTWIRHEALALQDKLRKPVKYPGEYIGGLVFLQALSTTLQRMEGEKRFNPEEPSVVPEIDTRAALEGVDEFFGKIKERSKTQ